MKKIISLIVVIGLIFGIYFTIVTPAMIAYENGDNIPEAIWNYNVKNINDIYKKIFSENNDNDNDNTEDNDAQLPGTGNNDGSENNSGGNINPNTFTTISSSGNTTRFNSICSFDESGYVWCTQKTSLLGFSGGCLLTSYSMLIINAGRYVGSEKNYDPVDVYLANNYKNSSIGDTTNPSNRKVLAYHYVIASGFNYEWNKISIENKSTNDKIAKLKEVLKTNPWGVIIGGTYGNGGTHFIVARLDKNENIIFDDPAYSSRNSGAKITNISNVYGINSWSNIKSIMTITPNLDKNGNWSKGTWENCLNDTNCHVCYKNQNC